MNRSSWLALCALVVVVSLSLLGTGCSSVNSVKQRDYVDPFLLESGLENVRLRQSYDSIEKELTREVKSKSYKLTVNPYTSAFVASYAEEQKYRKRLDNDAVTEKLKEAAELMNKGCFSVKAIGTSMDSANLDYFHLILVDSDKRKIRLNPMGPNSKPTIKEFQKSYTQHSRKHSRPSQSVHESGPGTRVVTYQRFQSSNIFCADKKLDLSDGFSLLVEPRFARGLPVEDMVWSADADDKFKFHYLPGQPYNRRSREYASWVKQRRKENKRAIRRAE